MSKNLQGKQRSYEIFIFLKVHTVKILLLPIQTIAGTNSSTWGAKKGKVFCCVLCVPVCSCVPTLPSY